MSMRSWPEYGIGLVLTSSRKIGERDEIDYLVASMGYDDVYELIELGERDNWHVWRFYDAEMEGKSFEPFADGKSYDEEPEEMLVIWASRALQPFSAAYSGPDEIRKEFQDIIGKYMPEDFDWDAHIGYFSCTIYC